MIIGKVRRGLKGNAVYVLPENLKGSYISSRNLSFPTSTNYAGYKDGKYIEMDTAVVLEVDLKTMTVVPLRFAEILFF